MKKTFRIVCLMLAVNLLFLLSGCGSNKNSFNLDSSDTYYTIDGDGNSDGANDALSESALSEKDKTQSGNEGVKNTQESKSSSGGYEYISEDLIKNNGFLPMEIPSRNNAYKLSNTLNKIKSGGTVNVVYFGGSVTGGTGSSNSSTKSWRALTTSYLKSISPGNVKEYNASLGGAGSYLGAARFEQDVISKKADLLFIEFAINDYYGGFSANQCKMNLEYMINRQLKQNPNTDIVMVLVTNSSLFGSKFQIYSAHKEVADHYHIPIVDFGGELYNNLKGSASELKKVFADSVHPNDTGHKMYAEIMIGALKELMVQQPSAAHDQPSSKLCGNGFSNLNVALAGKFSSPGWNVKYWFDNKDYEKDGSQFRYSDALKKIFPKYIAPQESGGAITYKFTGNSFGILGTVKESASLNVSIDGSEAKVIKGSPKPELLEYPVFDDLSNTAHTATITVTGYPPYVAIAALVTTTP